MNIVSEIVSHLQSTLNVKYLTKIGRDSSSNANDAMVHNPTDFPFYIEEDFLYRRRYLINKTQTQTLSEQIKLIVIVPTVERWKINNFPLTQQHKTTKKIAQEINVEKHAEFADLILFL